MFGRKMAQASINITCDCGAKMTVTPPKTIQEMPKELRYFDLNCCYCQGYIGTFGWSLSPDIPSTNEKALIFID
ncbi:hypothetical protein J41TS4_22590 [Paenibacillus apis]|uniref:Uncharacterized protein n=1 Tax=Paenibacillus apis TaxID=1792174 RepID=A0A919Y070_9BACL|nr:hypothetical protein J41TS4_22590 [Paenibacillus apis]